MGIRLGASGASAYQSVAAWTSVAVDDPRRLVVMLYDGALERVRQARGRLLAASASGDVRILDEVAALLGELREAWAAIAAAPTAP